MLDITIKSTGTLIDEWLTCLLKIEYKPTPDTVRRESDLWDAIIQRVGMRWYEIESDVTQLRRALRNSWLAQEIIMTSGEPLENIARAGITAQKENAVRTRHVRRIDEILGEGTITRMIKTYDF